MVYVGSQRAITDVTFTYVLKWSDPRTWGTDMPPIEGDLVFIPEGMTLLVDESTPKLKGIIAEKGTIMFDDSVDLVVQSGFITINRGKFIAGT